MIINYCIINDIGTLIVGYNPTIQQESHMGKKNNQNFVNLPIGQLKDKLNYLCKRHNITFNADVNGALNIIKKSKATKIDLQSKEYLSPIRLKVS